MRGVKRSNDQKDLLFVTWANEHENTRFLIFSFARLFASKSHPSNKTHIYRFISHRIPSNHNSIPRFMTISFAHHLFSHLVEINHCPDSPPFISHLYIIKIIYFHNKIHKALFPHKLQTFPSRRNLNTQPRHLPIPLHQPQFDNQILSILP